MSHPAQGPRSGEQHAAGARLDRHVNTVDDQVPCPERPRPEVAAARLSLDDADEAPWDSMPCRPVWWALQLLDPHRPRARVRPVVDGDASRGPSAARLGERRDGRLPEAGDGRACGQPRPTGGFGPAGEDDEPEEVETPPPRGSGAVVRRRKSGGSYPFNRASRTRTWK